jgi:hypothetical protein
MDYLLKFVGSGGFHPKDIPGLKVKADALAISGLPVSVAEAGI